MTADSTHEMPRFRQSYAKILLSETAAACKRAIDGDRKSTQAMRAGSLLDVLVFGQHEKIEVVEATYRSGPRKGEPCTDWSGKDARESKDRIESEGRIPVLIPELDEAEAQAEPIRDCMIELETQFGATYPGIVHRYVQREIHWTTEAGTLCSSTPDLIVIAVDDEHMITRVMTVDLKRTAFVHPDAFSRQVHAMGWDVQGHAYRCASTHLARELFPEHAAVHVQHQIVLANGTERPIVRWLGPVYQEVGKRRWERAERIWVNCLDTHRWPGYPDQEIEPTHYIVRRELERFDSPDADDTIDEIDESELEP